MKSELIHHKQGNDRLILIFAGWSTTPEFYSDLVKEGWDTMVCYDYSDFEFDCGQLSRYRTIYLYAWSLGVFVASCVLQSSDIAYSVAVNGTESPVSDTMGIPESIYMGTLNTLSERNLVKFRKRMYTDIASYDDDLERFVESDISGLRSQLENVALMQYKYSGKLTFRWNRIYISGNDRIFPPQNQHLAWKGRDGVVANDASHRPDLKKILDSTIIDIDRVGERFGRKMDTYDEYATVQRRIARTLASMIRDVSPDRVDSILEIGSGTGLLTRMYGPVLKPEKVDFIDLCAVPEYGIAPVERYFRGDAERLITDPELVDYDIITSASAIQWFTNLPLFLKNCGGRLKPNGVFAVSSFLPGNLCEFDALRPSPLHYLTESELSGALSSVFESYRVYGEEERVLFKSAAGALRHLSMTGVGAVGNSGIDSIRELKKYIPRTEYGEYYLTYRPVYIVASGPRRN